MQIILFLAQATQTATTQPIFQIVTQTGPNWWIIVAQFIAPVILVLVLGYFLNDRSNTNSINQKHKLDISISNLQSEHEMNIHKLEKIFDKEILIIKHSHEGELIRLNADLRLIAHNHETRFKKYYDKQFDALSDLYLILQNIKRLVSIHVEAEFGNKSDSELIDKVNEFITVFRQARIWLPENTEMQIENLHRQFIVLIRAYDRNQKNDEELTKIWNTLVNEIEPAFLQFKSDIRRIMDGSILNGNIQSLSPCKNEDN